MIVYKPAKVVLNFSYHNCEMLPLAAWSDCTSVLTVRRLFLMFLNFFWGGGIIAAKIMMKICFTFH